MSEEEVREVLENVFKSTNKEILDTMLEVEDEDIQQVMVGLKDVVLDIRSRNCTCSHCEATAYMFQSLYVALEYMLENRNHDKTLHKIVALLVVTFDEFIDVINAPKEEKAVGERN